MEGPDMPVFNAAVEAQGLWPTHTLDGVHVAFDELWPRRRALELAPGVLVAVPSLDDLILTKRFGGRPKDLEDIRLLESLRSEES